MKRQNGTITLDSRPGEGTQVRLSSSRRRPSGRCTDGRRKTAIAPSWGDGLKHAAQPSPYCRLGASRATPVLVLRGAVDAHPDFASPARGQPSGAGRRVDCRGARRRSPSGRRRLLRVARLAHLHAPVRYADGAGRRRRCSGRRPLPSPGMGNPGMQAPAARGRRFGGGFFAGLLGAGLLGALLGGGFFGGLGGIASMIGLLLPGRPRGRGGDAGAVRFFRRRNASRPAPARPTPARSLDGEQGPRRPDRRCARGPAGGMFRGGQRPPQARPVQIGPADYQSFERLLGDIQDAYSREDRGDPRQPGDARDGRLLRRGAAQ